VTLERWLENAVLDAERRGLPELKPLLEGLAQATALLRAARFDDPASDTMAQEAEHPPSPFNRSTP
jgi:hypothetical protein